MNPNFPAGYKPMLAFTPKALDAIKFPVTASPKLDGIRCVMQKTGIPHTRSLKMIPNDHIRTTLMAFGRDLADLDGEIMTYTEDGRMKPLNEVNGDVMRRDGKPNFMFWVFDDFSDKDQPYCNRIYTYTKRVEACAFALIKPVPTRMINSLDELLAYEAEILAQGYEGVMYRQPYSTYKFGRSTEREGGLGKLKRFIDAEAVIVGFVEMMRNENEATKDAFGRTERSTAKAGLVPAGMLGALQVVAEIDGVTYGFELGTGFTMKQRMDMWRFRDQLHGRLVTFKYREIMKSAPVLPVFKTLRDPSDLALEDAA